MFVLMNGSQLSNSNSNSTLYSLKDELKQLDPEEDTGTETVNTSFLFAVLHKYFIFLHA